VGAGEGLEVGKWLGTNVGDGGLVAVTDGCADGAELEQIWHKGETRVGEPSSTEGLPCSGHAEPKNMLATEGRRFPSESNVLAPHAQRSWLKAESWKMESISNTEVTFQDEMSWLKELAFSKARHMLTTDLTSHEEMSPLND